MFGNLGRLDELPRARLCRTPTPIEAMPNQDEKLREAKRLGEIFGWLMRSDSNRTAVLKESVKAEMMDPCLKLPGGYDLEILQMV